MAACKEYARNFAEFTCALTRAGLPAWQAIDLVDALSRESARIRTINTNQCNYSGYSDSGRANRDRDSARARVAKLIEPFRDFLFYSISEDPRGGQIEIQLFQKDGNRETWYPPRLS